MKWNAMPLSVALFCLTSSVWAAGLDENLNSADQQGWPADNHNTFGMSNNAFSGGADLISDSYNGWKGISQNVQSSGVQSLTQQNIALQVNETDKSAEDEQSPIAAIGFLRATNVANQMGSVHSGGAENANTGSNTQTGSLNNWKGLNENVQDSSIQSLTQQNVALQSNGSTNKETHAIVDDQPQAPIYPTGASNTASQEGGAVSYSGERDSITGDNAITGSNNGWKGLSQNAQNSSAQSMTKQNVAIQINEGTIAAPAVVLADQSGSAAIGLVGAMNEASQSGGVHTNAGLDNVTTGSNSLKYSHNQWRGVSQNLQDSSAQSQTQQNLALQLNKDDKVVTAAGLEIISYALNVASQNSWISDLLTQSFSTGDNVITGSYGDWKGISQNTQNSGAQSVVQQNLAVQVDGLDRGSNADVELASNIAAQVGKLGEGLLGVQIEAQVSTGKNAIAGSYNEWRGVSQNTQNNGGQSMIQQNMAVQALGGVYKVAGAVDERSLAIGLNLHLGQNRAEQSAYLDSHISAGGATGNNSLQGSYNDWRGFAQNVQNAGLQSMIQQNVAVQAHMHQEEGIVGIAADALPALAGDGGLYSNMASQFGGIQGSFIATASPDPVLTSGSNGIEQAFNGWKGIVQNAQNSGIQSLTQQSVAVQVNTSVHGMEVVGALDSVLLPAPNADLASNVATQAAAVSASNIQGQVTTGNNTINGSGSFNNWSGLSQNVQNSGMQSVIQQNVAVQANLSR